MAAKNKQMTLLLLLFAVDLVTSQNSTEGTCVHKGQIHTTLNWYGYLLEKNFVQSISKIQYLISYPVTECCTNLLIYYDDQMRNITPEMSCKQREEVLPPTNHQIIPLAAENCDVWDGSSEGKQNMFVCAGERTFRSSTPRKWYIAISRCGATKPLTMNYYFNISGFAGGCEEDPLNRTVIPPKPEPQNNTHLHVAIAMGVLAGLTTIAAIVFATLLFISRRQIKQKPKTSGSVTSSQATMTQDIFYVNPSLSDRDHSDSQYSRSSSENYYEVIPDRRSYDSINTQLALHGHAGRAINLASIPREHRGRITSYLFEDIPPPPYQPPNGIHGGQGHPGQGHGHPHGHHSNQSSYSHQSQGSGSGHPLTQTSGPVSPSSGVIQQIPMNARLLPISTQTGSPNGGPGTMVATTTRMPLQSSAHAMTSGNSLIVPNHSSSGNHSSAGTSASGSGPQQQTQNGGITTSAGGLNSHNTNTLPRSQNSDLTNALQNGGPIPNGLHGHGSIGRYPHNANHAKLLNHAYRIQQFETTA